MIVQLWWWFSDLCGCGSGSMIVQIWWWFSDLCGCGGGLLISVGVVVVQQFVWMW